MQGQRPKQPAIREDRSRAASGVGKVHSSKEASNDRGAKGPEFKGNAGRSQSAEIDMSLTTPPSVRAFRTLSIAGQASVKRIDSAHLAAEVRVGTPSLA